MSNKSHGYNKQPNASLGPNEPPLMAEYRASVDESVFDIEEQRAESHRKRANFLVPSNIGKQVITPPSEAYQNQTTVVPYTTAAYAQTEKAPDFPPPTFASEAAPTTPAVEQSSVVEPALQSPAAPYDRQPITVEPGSDDFDLEAEAAAQMGAARAWIDTLQDDSAPAINADTKRSDYDLAA